MKKQILDTARKLFNVYGIKPVTARLICTELSISPGSFSYHYPNKDLIVETLTSDLLLDFDQCFINLEAEELTINELISIIKLSFIIQHKYRFFYLNQFELCSQQPKIKASYFIHNTRTLNTLKQLLSNLYKSGLLKNNVSPEETHELAVSLQMLIQQWPISAEHGTYDSKKKKVDHYTKTTLFIILPYLSKQAKKDCKSHL